MRFFQKNPSRRPPERSSFSRNPSRPKYSKPAPIEGGVVFETSKHSQPAPKEPDADNAGKTRLIGFDTSDGRLDLFDDKKKVQSKTSFMMPVGLVMVVDGPGRGHCFALQAGMSTIGRADDQTVSLDFGDRAISRQNHAAIVYDAKTHEFLLGHGGKANLVRLNGKPVVVTEPMEDGASIQIGETTMRFVAICNDDFNWNDDEAEEDDEDVAYI